MYSQKFLILFAALLVSLVIPLAIQYPINADVRGWWPFILAISIFVYLVYSGIFLLIDRLSPSSIRYVLGFAGITSSFVLLNSVLSYALSSQVDWAAVSDETRSLSLIEKIVTSDMTFWGILVVSLCIHAGLTSYRRHTIKSRQ